MKHKLTDLYVKKVAPPAQGQIDIFDEQMTGLVLRVSASGRKSWNVCYRHHGRNRRLTLGRFPIMGLADARERARRHLLTVADGGDPAGKKQQGHAAETFGGLAASYLKWAESHKRARSWMEDRRILDHDLLPAWQHRKVADISRREVKLLIEGIAARGAGVMANRTLALVSRMLNVAIEDELIEANVASRIPRPGTETRSDRVLNEAEIRTLWAALEGEERKAAMIFKLGLLTAQRRGEVTGMRWEEIDLDTGWWTLPAERSKNKKSHRIPLVATALGLLRELRADGGDSPFVFASPKLAAPLTTAWNMIERLRRHTGIEFKFHDLRRTAGSLMTGLGIPRLVVSKLLNHTEAGITSIYDRHSYDNEKRAALIKWDVRLREIVTGASAPKVVSIHAGA